MIISMRSGLTAIGLAVFIGGCAHPITIAPNTDQLARDEAKPRIEKQVAYYISAPNRALRVTTPAGGGDSVSYLLYADLEAGLVRVLGNVFAGVFAIQNPQDKEFLRSKNISYVFTPTITTTSSSRNAFFWPPTDFSVKITCTATDSQEAEVWNVAVQADGGLLAVKETLTDHGIAAKRAAENALKKLQIEIEAAPVFRK